MARPSTTSAGSNHDLLSVLSAERRQELLVEALGAHIRELFDRHKSANLGELVAALMADSNWGLVREMALSSVVRAKPEASPSTTGAPLANAGNHAGAEAGKTRRKRVDQALLDAVLEIIKKMPGLRSEQIFTHLHEDRVVLKAALAKLRGIGAVNTSGHKRATTYAAP